MYTHPFYNHAPMYNSNFMSRNGYDINQQVLEDILTGIKREATAVDFYSRLANVAPDPNHKKGILNAIENKKVIWRQLTDLYVNLAGTRPVFQIDQVMFRTYKEGLQKAAQAEIAGFEEYRNIFHKYQHPLVRGVLLRVMNGEQEDAVRFNLFNKEVPNQLTDYGPEPFAINIEEATKKNNTFRTALWTGEHLQVTLMSINVGEDIGLEIHPTLDQFLRIEQGQGLVQMGDNKNQLDFEEKVYDDFAIVIPAGKWHNLRNTGNEPLKLYSIYAPPQHPYGTVHETKAIAMAAEEEHH